MTNTLRKHTLAIGAAAAALAIAAPASAGDQVKTKIKIAKLTATKASGTVSSKEPACEGGRKVTLTFVGDYVPVKVGKAKTKDDGRWKVKGEFEPGLYFAKVKKASADSVKCKAAKSADERLRD